MILRKEKSVFHEIGNLFETTIFVLVSAVQKISRKQKIESGKRLYRGLGGKLDLPKQFYDIDANGCAGFCEWGFMSTTEMKSVALNYSGVQDKSPKPTVLVVQVSSVDRGACIKTLSQYQNEIEYLWLPCSFVEQVGPRYLEVTEHGAVTMIPVKINCNLKLPTVGALISQKKERHLQSFNFLRGEVKSRLENYGIKLFKVKPDEHKKIFLIKDLVPVKSSYAFELAKLCDSPHQDVREKQFSNKLAEGAMKDCDVIFTKQSELDTIKFLDSSVYRNLIAEMMIAVQLPDLKLLHISGFPFYFTGKDVRNAISCRTKRLGSSSDNYSKNSIEDIFIKFADPHLGTQTKTMSTRNVHQALRDLSLDEVTPDELEMHLSAISDTEDHILLNQFEELVRMCESSTWSMKWAAALPLTELVGRALSVITTTMAGESDQNIDPVRFFALIEPSHAEVLAYGLLEYLKDMFLNSSKLLRKALMCTTSTHPSNPLPKNAAFGNSVVNKMVPFLPGISITGLMEYLYYRRCYCFMISICRRGV
jgi:hypothetical protein